MPKFEVVNDKPYHVKVYTIENMNYPAVFEFKDPYLAVLYGLSFAFKDEIFYTQVIYSPVYMIIAQFNMKYIDAKGLHFFENQSYTEPVDSMDIDNRMDPH